MSRPSHSPHRSLRWSVRWSVRWSWRAVAAPLLVATMPALALAAGGGPTATGGSAAPRVAVATTAQPTDLAVAFVRSRTVAAPVAGLVRSAALSTSRRYAGSINTDSRAAVDRAYRSLFAPGLDVGTGWTGSVDGCRRGTNSSYSRRATVRAINFARSLSGLAPVWLSSRLNSHAQSAALIMDANDQLSHYPSSAWRCYSRTGASTAARSNLALAYPDITSAGLVQMYLDDLGGDNLAVGHRRWLLNPFATSMGSGSTGTANALQVVGPTSSRRPNPAWVSWPSRGWFPDTLEPHGRWSLSAGNGRTDFRRARVRVYHDGQRVYGVRTYRVENGYARPTLVWQMPADASPTGSYTVRVSNIGHRGTSKRSSTHYGVRFFTPSR